MPRIRTIKPEFFKHSGLFDLERETKLPIRLAYEGLWCCADREGRFKWRPRELKVDILPYDDLDFEDILDALEGAGFVVHYDHDDESFGWIPTFLKHQAINHREAQSSLPPFPKGTPGQTRVHPGTPGETVFPLVLPGMPGHAPGERKGREGKGISDEVKNTSSSPRRKKATPGHVGMAEFVYKHYPRKEGHRKAIEEIDKALARLGKGEAALSPMSKPDAQEFLLRRVETYARSPAGLRADREMIPHPATWFHQSRYLDDESNWKVTGGANGKHESAGRYDSIEAIGEELIREHHARLDQSGDLPWSEDGQDADG